MSSYGDIFRRYDSQQTEELSSSSLQGGRILRVFRMQRIGSFLLHLTSRFGFFPSFDLHPFQHDGSRALPIRRPILFVFFIHELCPYHPTFLFRTPLCESSRVSLATFPPYLLFLVVFISFYIFASVCLFYHTAMHNSILFITLSHWLYCCLVLLILIFFFSLFLQFARTFSANTF